MSRIIFSGYANQMRKSLEHPDLEPLNSDQINHAELVLIGLYRELMSQGIAPTYQEPVEGWGLTASIAKTEGFFEGAPTTEILGHRELYLSTRGVLRSVLKANHPKRPFETIVIANNRTSVGKVVREDPSLYLALLSAIRDGYVEDPDFGLKWPTEAPSLEPIR